MIRQFHRPVNVVLSPGRETEVGVSDTSSTGSTAGPDRAAQERARARAGQQGLLFTDDLPQLNADLGYRGPTAC